MLSVIFIAAVNYFNVPFYEYILAAVYGMTIISFFIMIYRIKQLSFSFPMIFVLGLIVSLLFSSMGYFFGFNYPVIYLTLFAAESCLIDICSYFAGKLFGQSHIFPVISPNKTLEGYIGGIVVPVLFISAVMLVFSVFGFIIINWFVLLLFMVCIALATLFGDLAMSVIKRAFGKKDYGKIFPGHGGILDRFDGFLFAAPGAYLFICFFGEFIWMI